MFLHWPDTNRLKKTDKAKKSQEITHDTSLKQLEFHNQLGEQKAQCESIKQIIRVENNPINFLEKNRIQDSKKGKFFSLESQQFTQNQICLSFLMETSKPKSRPQE